jgi:2-polyprenyl-3-methyl-5-hydroxy-6-metoxy-1,4-benzoquinol methylase
MSSPDNYRRKCLLCDAAKFTPVYGENHFIIRCNNCGLVTTKLIPTNEELKKYYDEYPSYKELSILTIQRYNEILDMLERFRDTNNLLETGCGFGFFLEEARKRNWNVFGTELSQNAIDECIRKKITTGESLDQIASIASKKFDAVVSIEVIEHLPDPAAEIKKYSEIVRPGGAVYITTPNFNSVSRRTLGSKWNVLLYPEHLNYFTVPTIRKLMSKFNFEEVKHTSSGLSLGRLIYFMRSKKKSTKEYLSDYDYNGRDRQMRDSIEKNVFLRFIKNTVNSILSAFNAGDTLKILYTKK